MYRIFDIILSKDNMQATISPKELDFDSMTVEMKSQIEQLYTKSTMEDLVSFLKNKNIVYGLKQDVLEKISRDFKAVIAPVVVAEGTVPIPGEDGYLIYEHEDVEHSHDLSNSDNIDFREKLVIQNVKSGDLLAVYYPPTKGIDGTNVLGETVWHKKGKRLAVKVGKHAKMVGNYIYAAIDGQVKRIRNGVDVNPVFTVNGDLDMSVGNIDFVGNVEIRGGVGKGFVIKAGGDVLVNGLVDNSSIIAKGDIKIRGGILGDQSISIEAGGNLYAHYLNGANITVNGDVIIENSIIQSNCRCFGKITCEKGSIYGGKISCIEGLVIQNVGNDLFVKTDVFIGVDQEIIIRISRLRKMHTEKKEELKRSEEIIKKLLRFKREQRELNDREKQLIGMQKKSYENLLKEVKDIEEELKSIEDLEASCQTAELVCKGAIFPNVTISFGKYAKTIKVEHSHVRVKLKENEIVFLPF